MNFDFGKMSNDILFLLNQSEYGNLLHIYFLISSSNLTLLLSKSTLKISPDFRLPFSLILFLLISNTPDSDAIIILLSLVIVYLIGLKPFLSNTALILLLSLYIIAAGPSQGSIIDDLNS